MMLSDAVPAVLFGLGGTLALFWSARETVNEVGYPLDGAQGALSLIAFYAALGWLFSALTILANISESSLPTVAATLLLAGCAFAGVIRLYALTRSFSVSPPSLASPPLASEIALLAVTLLFGLVILLSAVLDYAGFLAVLEPRRPIGNVGGDPQAFSVLVLVGSLCVFFAVELFWFVYSLSPPHHDRCTEVAAWSVAGTLERRTGVITLRVFEYIETRGGVHTEKTLYQAFGNRFTRQQIQEALDTMREFSLTVSTVANGVRRHPHFHKWQAQRAQEERRRFEHLEDVDRKDVQELLRWHAGKRREPPDVPAILAYSSRFRRRDYPEVATELLNETLRELKERHTEGAQLLLVEYLEQRFWAQMTEEQIGASAGYKRESIHRKAYWPSIDLLRRELVRKLRS